MRDFTMFQADAFADRLFAGNPAAVMVLDAALPDDLMQALAAENNQSETAFVVSRGGGHAIRWFTPTHEAAFCGHATLAAAHILMTEYGHAGPLEFSTGKVGLLRVVSCGAGYELDLPRHDATPVDVVPDALMPVLPDGWVAILRNFENHFVILRDARAVRDYVPDFAMMKRLGNGGIAITGPGGMDHAGRPVDFSSRFFAPAHGIDEDPVTGSAHATLAPYWAGVLGRAELSAFQASRRGGRIGCRVTGERVYLTGQAITYLKGAIRLPV